MTTGQSPRKRIMTALRGNRPDKIPFTVYECMIPQCTTERLLRNRGLGIIKRILSYREFYPNVRIESQQYSDEQGRSLVRTVYHTPKGDLSALDQPAGFTVWHLEHLFKSQEDYPALLSLICDAAVAPDYNQAVRIINSLGDDFAIRDNLPLEPLQNLISNYMGAETFAYEWMDNRDEILKLYQALVERARKIYPLVADGPLEFCNYGGNVVPQLIGKETFETYYTPHYHEAAEILHRKGKLLGCHFDADNTPIMEAIAGTDLDYIEAYDAGMSPPVSTARKIFSNKVLWLNWPSTWHLLPCDEIRSRTVDLMRQASPGNGFMIGITEDVPDDRWQKNFMAIMDGIEEFENT